MKALLQELIADFRYGKYNWLKTPPVLTANKSKGTFTVDPFFHGDKTRTDGDCLELSVAAMNRIRTALPHANVFYCFGNHVQYAPRLNADNHTFLAVFPEGREPPFEEHSLGDWLQVVDNAGALLVDPALRYVGRFPGSGYIVQNIVEDVIEPSAGPCTNQTNQLFLLGRSPNGSIVTFRALFDSGFALRFCLYSAGEARSVPHSELKQVVRKNKELLALVETIRNAPIHYE